MEFVQECGLYFDKEKGGGAEPLLRSPPPSCLGPIIEILPLSLSFYSLLLSFDLFSVPFLEFLSPSLLLLLPPLFSDDLLLLELNQLLLPVLQVQVLTLENEQLCSRFYRETKFLLLKSIHST